MSELIVLAAGLAIGFALGVAALLWFLTSGGRGLVAALFKPPKGK